MTDPVAPPAAPDFPAQLEAFAIGFHGFIEKRYTPGTAALVFSALKWMAQEEIAKVDTAESQLLGKILGGFFGGLAAPGIHNSTNALLGQIESDAIKGS